MSEFNYKNNNLLEISIIVPIYNVEEYLKKCILSILNQTYHNLDIILVDDGSTDSSGIICDQLAQRDSRITVIHQNNQGLIRARYNGLKCAKGEYVTFVDSDDWIDENMYADMVDIIRETNVEIVLSGIYRYFSDTDIILQKTLLKEGYYKKEEIEEKIIPYMLWSNKWNDWELDPSLCTKLCKKELLLSHIEKVKDMHVYFGEDSIVIFPMILNVASIYITSQSYYYHRQRSKGEIPSYIREQAYFDKVYKVYKYLQMQFECSEYKDVLIRQLDNFYMNAIQLKRRCYISYEEKQGEIFPFQSINRTAKVAIYGAGEVGRQYVLQNEEYHFCEIVLWVDKQYEILQIQDQRILSPEMLMSVKYDYIIIAVKNAGLAKEIKQELVNAGIESSKIIWRGNKIQKID